MSAIERTSLGEKIAWVAVAINTPEIFRERARLVTEELDSW